MPPESGFDLRACPLDGFVLELLSTQCGLVHQTGFGDREHRHPAATIILPLIGIDGA